MERKILLKSNTGEASLSVVYDDYTESCSIAVLDGTRPKIKFISKELYDMLVKELDNKEY